MPRRPCDTHSPVSPSWRPPRSRRTTRPNASVSTPRHAPSGPSPSQFTSSAQFGPSVAAWSATSAARSPLSTATVTVAVPATAPTVAAIVVVPLPAAATSPDAPTVATAASRLVQITTTPGIARPLPSRTRASSCTVASGAVSDAAAGVTVTLATRSASDGGRVASSPHPDDVHAATAQIANEGTRIRVRWFVIAEYGATPRPANRTGGCCCHQSG